MGEENKNDERVELKVLGITYNQLRADAYALILAQVDGQYRIPVMVGVFEARAIAMNLEGVIPPRPITHDLIVSMQHAFGIELEEVFIYKFADGVFMSELKFKNDNVEVSLDSRTSDAIAIALRTGARIFTTRGIMEVAGYIDTTSANASDKEDDGAVSPEEAYDNCSLEKLEKMLQVCVEQEAYEVAAEIKKAIDKKKTEKQL